MTYFNEDEINDLQEELWNVGITYPTHILERRLRLLNQTELEIVYHAYKYICRTRQKINHIIDVIISHRAEKENDPWE